MHLFGADAEKLMIFDSLSIIKTNSGTIRINVFISFHDFIFLAHFKTIEVCQSS